MLARAGYRGRHFFHTAAVATGVGTALQIADPDDGSGSVLAIQINGITTATVTFQGTIDGTNWVDIGFTDMADNSTVATTATADGIYKCSVAGLLQVRANLTAWTTGTITVTGNVASIT